MIAYVPRSANCIGAPVRILLLMSTEVVSESYTIWLFYNKT